MSDTPVGSAVGARVVPGMMVGIVVSPGFVAGIPGVVLSEVRGFETEGDGAGMDGSCNVWLVHPAASIIAVQRKKRMVPE